MSQARSTPTYDELESLFVNNDKLDHISAYLNRFNPIKVMGMERMEIRHSAILGWLLNPSETHGLGDRFLKAFLGEALRGQSGAEQPTALNISQSDLRDAEIRLEWQHIDIFILSEANGWAFIIENKFDSSQSEGQLSGYADKVRNIYKSQKDLKIRGIFLTLRDEEPEDSTYAPIKYANICEILERLMGQHKNLSAPEVTTFLAHYLEIIRDATEMSETRTEMEKLARQLYRDNKKALDFVIEQGASSDFAFAANEVFAENAKYPEKYEVGDQDFVFYYRGKDYVYFWPHSWHAALGAEKYPCQGCENWAKGFPLVTWFSLSKDSDGTKGQLTLYAAIGPISDHTFRKALIDAIAELGSKKISFQGGATDKRRKSSKFFKNNTTTVEDIHDLEKISHAMKKLLKKFQPEFEAVAGILPQFIGRGSKQV
jgi:PD-(D/E)XK nuclease superfamily